MSPKSAQSLGLVKCQVPSPQRVRGHVRTPTDYMTLIGHCSCDHYRPCDFIDHVTLYKPYEPIDHVTL